MRKRLSCPHYHYPGPLLFPDPPFYSGHSFPWLRSPWEHRTDAFFKLTSSVLLQISQESLFHHIKYIPLVLGSYALTIHISMSPTVPSTFFSSLLCLLFSDLFVGCAAWNRVTFVWRMPFLLAKELPKFPQAFKACSPSASQINLLISLPADHNYWSHLKFIINSWDKGSK